MFDKLKNSFNTVFKSTEMRIAEASLVKINSYQDKFRNMSDQDLRQMTEIFRKRLQEGETLEDIREEAFATAREATYRILGKFPYDVQMIGGIILDLGSVAEMKTGEGKTITSIAPVYLNALESKGVIVSTVNEYLAERDALEMGQVHNFLGITVCTNKPQMDPNLKRQMYACDVTYSIHSELGFDYLRDNMVKSMDQKVQRGLNYILIDEVDSILIDEAKTPLIISGGEENNSALYQSADQYVRTISKEDFEIDEESKTIKLTESGINKANKFFNLHNLYDIKNSELVHRIQNALRAHKIMSINVEYIVREGKIELVDAFTGRVMEGRAYSEGLQQAIQAKELLEIEPETKTLATITYQNFFRMFKKLSGMTGTGKTEEQEFIDIYNMRVNVIPTNKPIVRIDDEDVIYLDMESKNRGIVNEVKRVHATGQPLLIGTQQIEQSEELHRLFKKEGIPHTVLNALQNSSEADIVSRAGKFGAVTIATNMAGRGTDIKPDKKSLEVGGLYVLGTEKAESRRIDNQLRGRSGRQGDIGYSRFFLSLDDQLILRFSVQDRWKKIFAKAGQDPINDKGLLSVVNRAQKKIEGFNYDSRKTVLNYDDVIRQQRDLIYSQRDLILTIKDHMYIIERMIVRSVEHLLKLPTFYLQNGDINYEKFTNYLNEQFLTQLPYKFKKEKLASLHKEELISFVSDVLADEYEELRLNIGDNYGEEVINAEERIKIITQLDALWQNHINSMDKLRSNTNLVQYAQKNPYQVYTEQGTKKFDNLLIEIALQSVASLFNNYSAQPRRNAGDIARQHNLLISEKDIEALKNNDLSSLNADLLPFVNTLNPEQRKQLLDAFQHIVPQGNNVKTEPENPNQE
ncbi:protein translocase subunit secA [Mycoplasma testudineum]|uniref:Protein translocase subunit SecA n=1 Tax=Mycoplasma testudineum TaxID=244584 RepID=A0A4R6IDK8_9MOLU|nr:preprotein translocase subunit SecA [Mycoplasma testudineum]OYD26819.1 preprotein translocase subunit SecA [Mycoplasma testudineum]TDO20353.1 protein translocase subunit secA [Mycoplasma testudineum]